MSPQAISRFQHDEVNQAATAVDSARQPLTPKRRGNVLLSSASKRLKAVKVFPEEELTHPKSLYEANHLSLASLPEQLALSQLLDGYVPPDSNEPYVEIDVRRFCVYRPDRPYLPINDGSDGDGSPKRDIKRLCQTSAEFEALTTLCVKNGINELVLDGFLQLGCKEIHVEGLRICNRSIGGYGHDEHVPTAQDLVWVQGPTAKAANVWYRLRDAAPEYSRFHEGFSWVATLAMHFVNFLWDCSTIEMLATLNSFRSDFFKWLQKRYWKDASFLKWHEKYGRDDFRIAICANVNFLWGETFDVNRTLTKMPIWRECMPERLSAISPRPAEHSSSQTIVTPFAYQFFEKIRFADILDVRSPAKHVQALREKRLAELGFVSGELPQSQQSVRTTNRGLENIIDIGDVVSINRDLVSRWGRRNVTQWYAYVQGIQPCKSQIDNALNVIWLYSADDILEDAKYLVDRELFFSDHCNCTEEPFTDAEVNHKVSVDWLLSDDERKSFDQVNGDFFVRSKYNVDRESFTSIRKQDFCCACKRSETEAFESLLDEYPLVTPVLFEHEDRLVPGIVDDFNRTTHSLSIRRLLRQQDFNEKSYDRKRKDVEPNEVVWTDDVLHGFEPKKIDRRFHLRFYSVDQIDSQHVPTPYDRRGVADCYYFSSRFVGDGTTGNIRPLEFAETLLLNYTAGFDPQASTPLFKTGLSMFSGYGNLDHGLEESGIFNFTHAIDLFPEALHSYRANVKNPEKKNIILGDVNHFLADAISGDYARFRGVIPNPGEIDCFVAGFPCQGWSRLQKNRLSDKSKQNASLMVLVLSVIDLYRPKAGVLENVTALAYSHQTSQGQNPFALLLFALVVMGYQVQPYIGDAWSYGDSQSRERLFISFASPGVELPRPPPATHSHPPGTVSASLGIDGTGAKFCERRLNVKTPFKFVSAREATRHLPDIGDGRTQQCIPYPDHRTSYTNSFDRGTIKMIPVFPLGAKLSTAQEMGKLSVPQLEKMALTAKGRTASSRDWQRAHPDRLFRTVTTRSNPKDKLGGSALHWSQQRCLTLEERRIAQGIPKDEVIIGSFEKQHMQIGNGVSRSTALAIGMSWRAANSWKADKRSEVVESEGEAALGEPSSPREQLDIASHFRVRKYV